jgi:hypothetical protein
MNKLTAVLLILAGEALSIYAEIKTATVYGLEAPSIGKLAFGLVGCIAVGGVMLLGGYVLGLRAFKSIWIVGTISVASIVVAEPVLAYGVAGQTPTRSALWGFLLSLVALLISTF